MKTNPIFEQLQFSYEYLSHVAEQMSSGFESGYEERDVVWAVYDYLQARYNYVTSSGSTDRLNCDYLSLSKLPQSLRSAIRAMLELEVTADQALVKKFVSAWQTYY